jgi:hypothetical protein
MLRKIFDKLWAMDQKLEPTEILFWGMTLGIVLIWIDPLRIVWE